MTSKMRLASSRLPCLRHSRPTADRSLNIVTNVRRSTLTTNAFHTIRGLTTLPKHRHTSDWNRKPSPDYAGKIIVRSSSATVQSTVSPSSVTDEHDHIQPYTPPTTGLLAHLPKSWVPYAELIRLDKPTGTYYLFFPCMFSTLLAAPLTAPATPLLTTISTTALFFSGALIMRGAGCTINDLWDRNLDPHVARTRLRPIARRAVTPEKAIIFTGAQLFAGLGFLLSFPHHCLFYGVPSLLFVTIYPLMKRVTYYPQFVLGLTFSWGAMMGFPALGVDLLQHSAALHAAGYLYASNVAWTVLYDMIYAHMDIKDDAKAGIKSIALAHAESTKAILSGLAVTQIGLLAAAGAAVGAGPVFFIGSCGSAAATLAAMIWKVNLKSVKDCWWWFRYGCLFTGGGISAGLFGEYLAHLFGWYDEEQKSLTIEPTAMETGWQWISKQMGSS